MRRESESEPLHLKEFPNNHFRFFIIVESAARTIWWIALVQRLAQFLLLTRAVWARILEGKDHTSRQIMCLGR